MVPSSDTQGFATTDMMVKVGKRGRCATAPPARHMAQTPRSGTVTADVAKEVARAQGHGPRVTIPGREGRAFIQTPTARRRSSPQDHWHHKRTGQVGWPILSEPRYSRHRQGHLHGFGTVSTTHGPGTQERQQGSEQSNEKESVIKRTDSFVVKKPRAPCRPWNPGKSHTH